MFYDKSCLHVSVLKLFDGFVWNLVWEVFKVMFVGGEFHIDSTWFIRTIILHKGFLYVIKYKPN
jgi:hypothetical protein